MSEEEHVNENEEVQVDEEVHDNHENDDATDDVRRGRHYENKMGEKEFADRCGFNFLTVR